MAPTNPTRGIADESDSAVVRRIGPGAVLTLLAYVAVRALSALRLAVFARFLAPAEFGLMSLALTAISGLKTVSNSGFQAALVQRKRITRADLDTAWSLGIVRGLLLTSCAIVIAPTFGEFVGHDEVVPLVQTIGLGFLFSGLANVGAVYLQRNLRVASFQGLALLGSTCDFVVATLLLLLFRDVWALAAGYLAGKLAYTLASYYASAYRPRPLFNAARATRLFRFGRWILLSGFIIYLLEVAGEVLIARTIDLAAVGLYGVAYRVPNLVATAITHSYASIVLPAVRVTREEPAVIEDLVFTSASCAFSVGVPVLLYIALNAELVCLLFFGAPWLGAARALSILCAFAVVRIVNGVIATLAQGLGQPALNTLGSLVQLAVLLALFSVVAIGQDIALVAGVVTASAGCFAALVGAVFLHSRRHLGVSLAKAMAGPVVGGAAMLWISGVFAVETLEAATPLAVATGATMAFGSYIVAFSVTLKVVAGISPKRLFARVRSIYQYRRDE